MSYELASYELNEEYQKLSDTVRDFADTVVAPAAYEYDTKRSLPYDIIASMGEMGLFGLPFPKEYGGQGKDYFALCLAVEQLGRADQSIGVTLDEGRVAFAALSTGAAQGCLEEAVRYAKSRNVFGRSIGSNQHIAFKIARMQARVHTARLAYYDAALKMINGKPFTMEASIAKMVGSEAAMDNARDATQIFGGYGLMNENPVARHYRDSKVLEIGEGTTEVQLMIISRALGFTG
ncbi:MAG: acyl-CoA dehydrogenase family protein [Lacisediminihabitans sp.]